jgi:hypothetical protein
MATYRDATTDQRVIPQFSPVDNEENEKFSLMVDGKRKI